MRKQYSFTLLIIITALLVACSAGPKFALDKVDTTLTPQQVIGEAGLHRGKEVLWGGMIINSTNLEKSTRLEVLAYPLDSDHYPQTGKQPYGRFLLLRQGYLETVDYAPGRLITVVGRIDGTRTGKVDESDYTYPVIQAEQLHLWSQGEKSNTRFHFGIGVVFGH